MTSPARIALLFSFMGCFLFSMAEAPAKTSKRTAGKPASRGQIHSARKAPPGLCYSTKLLAVKKQEVPVLKTKLSRDERHALALKAASLVYKLGDLDTAKTGADFILNHERFYKSVPEGYRYMYYSADRSSGLKYMILSAKDPTLPWIFAFAGTETMKDWLSDMNLGRAQLERAKDLVQAFVACEFVDDQGLPLSSHRWLVTGHSLGGGLAQAFAYTFQRARLSSKLAPVAMELVTFNAFGAAGVVTDDNEGRPDARVVQALQASNYFVTGDPVSSIGKHLGRTYELELPDIGTLDLVALKTRHMLDAVKEAAIKGVRVQFSLAREKVPPTSTLLTQLAAFGQYLPLAPTIIADAVNARFTDLTSLEEASQILLERELRGPYDERTLAYIAELSESFLADIKKVTDVSDVTTALTVRLTLLVERLALVLKKPLSTEVERANEAS